MRMQEILRVLHVINLLHAARYVECSSLGQRRVDRRRREMPRRVRAAQASSDSDRSNDWFAARFSVISFPARRDFCFVGRTRRGSGAAISRCLPPDCWVISLVFRSVETCCRAAGVQLADRRDAHSCTPLASPCRVLQLSRDSRE